jgi:hypothetical protein
VIPTYEQPFLPLFKFASDGQEHAGREALELPSRIFRTTDEEKNQVLSNGRTVFKNSLPV